jgi:adenosyl cobinamide kinase/adenosyl cobinamide phosphate guanylyltransferase
MITLVLGGARSGKSAFAERLASRLPPPVTYLATAAVSDPDMAGRVAAHQARRPAGWRTLEVGRDLTGPVGAVEGTVLIDTLGTWLAGAPGFDVDGAGLCLSLRRRAGDSVVVSDEVGLGVHPETDVGCRFRDALGSLNQAVADVADDVVLVVAGRVLHVERPQW